MFMTVLIGALLLAAVGALVYRAKAGKAVARLVANRAALGDTYDDRRREDRLTTRIGEEETARMIAAGAAGVLAAVAVVMLGFTTMFAQDPGEARVLRSFTGQIQGEVTEPGLHFKAPWVKAVAFDVRNSTVVYAADGSSDYSGGDAKGPQITFQDREGVSGNLDLTVRYSLSGDGVRTVYEEFKTQENFVKQVIEQDVRSVSRAATEGFGTVELLTSRTELATKIRDGLSEKWTDLGVIVEEVSPQEIRYSADTTARLDEAQAARIAVEKAKADRDAAKVAAETKVVVAQGEADANQILTESLSDEILRQRYIDALNKASTVYVVPEGSTPFVNVPQGVTPTPTP